MEPVQTPINTVSQTFTHQHRLALIILGIVFVILYAGLNIWVYLLAKHIPVSVFLGIRTEKDVPQQTVNQSAQPDSSVVSAFQRLLETRETPTPTPTPTPRPTGPGPHACDPVGACKIYSDDVRTEKCTVTYADTRCLDQCGDDAKRCKP